MQQFYLSLCQFPRKCRVCSLEYIGWKRCFISFYWQMFYSIPIPIFQVKFTPLDGNSVSYVWIAPGHSSQIGWNMFKSFNPEELPVRFNRCTKCTKLNKSSFVLFYLQKVLSISISFSCSLFHPTHSHTDLINAVQ